MPIIQSVPRAELPVPDSEALEHSKRLCNRIREVIQQNNDMISFARFMEMALYEPGLGYYSGGASKFGEAGDFVTAPEISSLFTHCLARQCQQVLSELQQPSILEFGPGSGVMACDLLQFLEQKNCLPEKYLMLELSADLKQRQQKLVEKKIPHLANRIFWLDHLPVQPFTGIILGNEVLDAMPVNRLVMKNGSFSELCTAFTDDEFYWVHRDPEERIKTQINKLPDDIKQGLSEEYVTEINLQIRPWLDSLADILARGVMLFIDYGYTRHEYYHPQRAAGTLLCHYRHHVHSDPFLYPGLQDITASVDFTLVAEAALNAGFKVSGYTTQAHFLLDNGFEELINQSLLTSAIERAELGRQARILTMPGEMGERCKVISLTKDFSVPLTGFQSFDQRSRL
jgi:SAM-dependent MidA family methyltransferase